MRDKVRDKLSKKQYDHDFTMLLYGWTTCTWSALMAQRMSVALHIHGGGERRGRLPVSCRSRHAGAEDEAALFGGGVADSVA